MFKIKPSFTAADFAYFETLERQFLQIGYHQFHEAFYPQIPLPEGITDQEHFQNTSVAILDRLKRQKKVYISMDAFIEAMSGNMSSLLQNHSFAPTQKRWLWAIQDSYHLDDLLQNKEKKEIFNIDAIAFLLSCRKEFDALTILFNGYEALLIEKKDIRSNPFIFYAVYGHLQKVESLLTDALSPTELTIALQKAVSHGHAAVVGFLLQHVWKKIQLKSNKTCLLTQAAENGDLEIIVLLLEYVNLETFAVHNKGEALCKAATRGHLKIVRFFLESYTQEISLIHKDAAFTYAAYNGHSEIVSLMLEDAGANISVHRKSIVLRHIARNGYLTVVSILLDQIGEKCAEERVLAFREAVDYSQAEVVKAFLEHPKQEISPKERELQLKKAISKGFQKVVNQLQSSMERALSDSFVPLFPSREPLTSASVPSFQSLRSASILIHETPEEEIMLFPSFLRSFTKEKDKKTETLLENTLSIGSDTDTTKSSPCSVKQEKKRKPILTKSFSYNVPGNIGMK